MTNSSRTMIPAMLCAATVTAAFVSGKATRDALFLTALDVTALPSMLMATSFFSIALVAIHTRTTRGIAPARLVPASFLLSGVAFIAEWLSRSSTPTATAVIVYLHISGTGPLLASGFWLIVSERFDPHTAKRRFGQIAGAGTFGGLVGALLAERVATLAGGPAMLLLLAAFQFGAAWLVRALAASSGSAAPRALEAREPAIPARSGLRVIAKAPHLTRLAALVLLGTTSAALVEYLFKAKAVQTFGPGDPLLRFFSLYYAGSALITFLLQMLSSRVAIERFGLALTTSTPSIALLSGSIGSLLAPGFGSLLVARGAESIFRGSWFRAAYEVFYTPVSPSEQWAAKSVIDVALDRLGDAAGGGLVRFAIAAAPAAQSPTILAFAILTSLGALVASSQLNRWYMRTLEQSLVTRAGALRLDRTERSDTRTGHRGSMPHADPAIPALSANTPAADQLLDPLARDIVALRARDQRSVPVLSREDGISSLLVPHVIPLLAVPAVADYSLFALRKVAEEHGGALTDALLDPAQDQNVRRRLARVFSVCVSQRAADGLLLALTDPRFDVRFQAARSLASIVEKNPHIQMDAERVYDLVRQEVEVERPVWESRRLLDGFANQSALDGFVRDRASQSLAHVFTLLSLVLPREPLRIAFRSLQVGDAYMRGTALEYLEEVLPPAIRRPLWPFLLDRRNGGHRPVHGSPIAELLGSSSSLTLKNLADQWQPEALAGFGTL
jgi:AAA family ATP:ADP antiporter